MITLPCIVCGRELEPAFRRPAGQEDEIPDWLQHNQPHGGTTFRSRGQYGSTVFDPMSSYRSLEINVCDPCMLEKAREGRIIHNYEVPRPSRFDVTLWDGEDGEWCEQCKRAHFGSDDRHDADMSS